jgi:hypothetical protein
MDLTIEQIKSKRTALAAHISEAVNAFQKETGCTVKSIDLQHLVIDASNAPIRTNVSVKIAID